MRQAMLWLVFVALTLTEVLHLFQHPSLWSSPQENTFEKLENAVVVGCFAQQLDELADMFVDEDGNFRIETVINDTSIYLNSVDVLSTIQFQQATIQEQAHTIEALNDTLKVLQCHVSHPLAYPTSQFNYSYSSILEEGFRVDAFYAGHYVGSGSAKWRTPILASNGLVYAAPEYASSVLLINPLTNEATTLPISIPQGAGWGGVVEADNGKLYIIPVRSDNVIIIDTSNNNALDQTSIDGLGAGPAKWHSGAKARNNGKIYCAPWDATSVLIINPADDTAHTNIITGLSSTAAKYGGTVLANNDYIYFIPHNGDSLLIVNPGNDTFDNSVSVESASTKWWGGVLGSNGKIYGIPYSFPKVIVIDPYNNNGVSYINVSLPTNRAWVGGIVTGRGIILAIPHDTGSVLLIDPETEAVELINTFGVSDNSLLWSDGVFIPLYNRIYGIPSAHNHVLQIDLDRCG